MQDHNVFVPLEVPEYPCFFVRNGSACLEDAERSVTMTGEYNVVVVERIPRRCSELDLAALAMPSLD